MQSVTRQVAAARVRYTDQICSVIIPSILPAAARSRRCHYGRPPPVLVSQLIASRMPPHVILSTADILHEIFQHLRIDVPGEGKYVSLLDQENQRTLSRAARVSKAFCDPALRSLWWALPNGVEPALMLLSSVSVVRLPRLAFSHGIPAEYDIVSALLLITHLRCCVHRLPLPEFKRRDIST